MESIKSLKKKISETQDSNKGHFEVGRQFHSENYVNLKIYFHDIQSAKVLAKNFVERIKKDINPSNHPTTFVGFRSYCGNVLSLACNELENCNYYIVEREDDKIVWQLKPHENDQIKENIIIILPVSCTSSYALKIKEFLKTQDGFENRTIEKIINVFMIFHKNFDKQIDYSFEEIKKYYKLFNWSKIDAKKTVTIHEDDRNEKGMESFTIVDVYTALHLTHKCKLCFPKKKRKKEKLLHPYHPRYETTKLLDGYPKYVYDTEQNKSEGTFIKSSPTDFKRLFFDKGNIHFYGNIYAKRGRYNHFINGNLFYEANKAEILGKFTSKIDEIKGDYKKIVFITAEGVNNSAFLEDMLLEIDPSIEVSLLRFNLYHEFIDSFINSNKKILTDDRTDHLLIYFEEVMSGGGIFKLLSNYIKHYSDRINTIDYSDYNKHGFDYIFTLVDRTALNIEYEILKKLHSRKNTHPKERFIKFFELNAPVFTSPHMGNPIQNEEKIINDIKNASNLDALKKYIIENELIPKKIVLPQDLYEKISDEENKKYAHLGLDKSQFNLIKLYCTDVIYNELAELADSQQFYLSDIFNKIIDDNKIAKFTDNEKILKDIVLKILTKHPFIHYKNICKKVLKYCIAELSVTIEKLSEKIENQNELYNQFWSLRFYVKRLVELNSKFIISNTFFEFLYKFYSKNKVYLDLVKMTDEGGFLKDDYQKNQIKTFSAFLLYCYKRLVYNDFGTSIKLEKLIQKNNYLKKQGLGSLDFIQTTEVIRDNYFKFLDMLTLENIYPFHTIYNSEKHHPDPNSRYKSFDLHNYDFFRGNREGREFLNWDIDRKGNRFSFDELDIHEILGASFRNISKILQRKPTYTFLYKYNDTDALKDNHYYISTRNKKDDNIGSIIELNKDGLINQFINGIEHKGKTQSFYTILEKDAVFYTFTKSYTKNNKVDDLITKALTTDCKEGNVINNEENLYFFIRLSEVKKNNDNKEYIAGNGIIVISLYLEDISDFFSFIDSRIMRNLLYVRKFFLNEIKSKFESKSFLKILRQIETEKNLSKFNHGIDVLYKNSILLLEKSENIEEIKSLRYPFHQIYNQTRMLLTSTNLKEEIIVKTQCTLNSTIMRDIFIINMKLYNVYERNKISLIKLDCNIPEFTTPLVFRDIIIPELFYNIGKVVYKLEIPIEELKFTIALENNFLIISNPCNCTEKIKFEKSNGGIEVIKEILKGLGYIEIEYDQQGTTVVTKIQISE
ncbi:MAG: hypothetical protein QM710_02460 [Flavobacterium sp.]